MQHRTRFAATILTVSLALLLAIAPQVQASQNSFDSTFQHSHMRVENIQVRANYPDLQVEISRIGFTPSLILVEVSAKNTGSLPVEFSPETGFVAIGDFRVQANPFATQALGESRRSLIQPGATRRLVVVYPGRFGQRNWDENAVTALSVHLWQENQDAVQIDLSRQISAR